MMPAVSASSIVNGATLNVRGLAMGESFSTVTTTALSVPSAAVKSASWNLSWTTVKGGKEEVTCCFVIMIHVLHQTVIQILARDVDESSRVCINQ